MTGTSYNGTLPLAAATTGVDGLEAIIPIAPNTSYYHYYRANGLVRHPGGYMGEDVDVLYNFIHSGDPEMREHCNSEIRDKEMAEGQDRETGDYNEFLGRRDYMNDLGPFKAATLMPHGFNDWNVMPSHTLRIYAGTQGKRGSRSRPIFTREAMEVLRQCKQMNRWFTRYLHGIENGVEKDPRSWVVREDAKRDEPTAYADYPNPDATPVKLHLNSGGQEVAGLSLEPAEGKQGTETLVDDVGISGSASGQAENLRRTA